MDDSQGDGTRGDGAQELILRTIAAHADSLLRTARRHSICVDDAQDAYQRAIEIFMGRAHRLDSARAAGWLHVVVKREAQALRRERQRMLMSSEVDLDAQEAEQPTPEERALSLDMVNRSAEALKRLKPQELRALWLRAQGHSYSDIGAITGWSYTKVNRCLTEGRHSFLARYEGIESGEECRRWLGILSAIVDGEATPDQVVDVRPHLRNCPSCRATLKALRDSSAPLAALLPVPLVAAESGGADHLSQLVMRCYEAITQGLHERAVNSLTRTQALVEATAGGKVAAVAASAAAVAGGGYASVEKVIEPPAKAARAEAKPARSGPQVALRTASLASAAPDPVVATHVKEPKPAAKTTPVRREFGTAGHRRSQSAPEFRGTAVVRAAAASGAAASAGSVGGAAPPPPPPPPPKPAPEFGGGPAAPEFGP